MSGSLCLLLDTVYWSPICRKPITRLPPTGGSERGRRLHGMEEKLDFQQNLEKSQINPLHISSLNWVGGEWRNAKEKWLLRGCKWVGSCSVCKSSSAASSGYCCCHCSDKAEVNYFYTWNKPMIISAYLQHERAREANKERKKERSSVCRIPECQKCVLSLPESIATQGCLFPCS